MDSTEIEVWKDCPIRGDVIEISSLGRLRFKQGYTPHTWRSCDKETRVLRTRQRSEHNGSVMASLLGHAYAVSWLVATAFIDNPLGNRKAYHLNGDITDNRVCNLSWISNFQRNKKPPRVYKEKSDRERLMQIWGSIGTRCNNPNCWCYSYYGGRGIKRCEEWNHFKSFYEWSLNNGYKDGLQLDRIDNNGDYSPDNCRWVTREENGKNKRNNHRITIDGKAYTIAEVAKILGVRWHCVYGRVKRGWPPELILSDLGYKGNKSTTSGDKNKERLCK